MTGRRFSLAITLILGLVYALIYVRFLFIPYLFIKVKIDFIYFGLSLFYIFHIIWFLFVTFPSRLWTPKRKLYNRTLQTTWLLEVEDSSDFFMKLMVMNYRVLQEITRILLQVSCGLTRHKSTSLHFCICFLRKPRIFLIKRPPLLGAQAPLLFLLASLEGHSFLSPICSFSRNSLILYGFSSLIFSCSSAL